MYPRNAASPEPISIGAVVQISDGAVQTSGVTVRIKPVGVAEGDGAGTTSYSTDGVVIYTPTQAETDYTSFVVIAKKTGCIPVAVTVVTSAESTAGKVSLGGTQTANITGNITGNMSGSVGSVTGNVGGNVTGSVGSLATQAKADVNAEVDQAIADASLATASALATAQADLDILTGTDGVTLATSQPNYAPATSAQATAIEADTQDLQTQIGTAGAGLTGIPKTGYKLASDGLDSISTTAPSGVPTNFREMWVMVYRWLFKKTTLTSTTATAYADDGTTPIVSMAVSDDGTTQTKGAAT